MSLVRVLAVAFLLAAAPAAAQPTLVRDVKTGVWRGGTRDAKAPEADYVQPDTEIEPSIAVNPANPDNVVIAYQEGRIDSGGDATNGYATSLDGGRTWQFGELPGLTTFPGQGGQFDRASDAVVAFGPDNVVYANSLLFDQETGDNRSAIAVNVSKDGGRTWSAPVVFQDDKLGGLNDKNWIVVDTSDAPGHHKGRVYAIWDRVAPVVYDYCDHDCDQLSNWLPDLQTIDPVVFPGQGIGAYPFVMTDGSLGMALDITGAGLPTSFPNQTDNPDVEPQGSNHVFIEAPQAGSIPYPAPLAWSPPINIASNRSTGQPAQRAPEGMPAATADPKSGALYTTWDDGRFRSDGTNDVVLSRSTDGGQTWSAPVRVNPGPKDDHVDHYGATVAVGADGIVHVAYRVRNESGAAPLFSPAIDSYYQESRDGGKTFSDPVKIDSQPSNALYGAFSRAGTFEGDYDELATGGGRSYFVRCQGQPAAPGEPPALAASGTALELPDAGRGHQHQSCWVAVVEDLPAGAVATVPAPTPAHGTSTPALRLRLTRVRLGGHRLRLGVSASGAGAIRSVAFYVGKRRVGRAASAPYRVVVRVARRHRALRLRAVVTLVDGRRLRLARTLSRRAHI
jgi:hypothetical protein